MSIFIDLVPVSDIPDNRGVAVQCQGRELLVCKNGEQVHVIDNVCPHQAQPLTEGRVRNGYIFCPLHGMRFKLDTGEAFGQLTKAPLSLHEARVESGQVQVRLKE